MKKYGKHLLITLCCLASLQITPTVNALTDTPLSDTTSSTDSNTTPGASGTPNLNMSSRSLGLSGPLSVGVNYDTLVDTVFNAQYVQKLADPLAIGVLGEYGTNQSRINGTVGYQLYSNGLIKFSGEYLSQVLPFSFSSGDIDQSVTQTAYGVRFQHNVNQAALKNINAGGYWAKAPNVSLDDVTYVGSDDITYLEQRNLAGATSQGLDVGGTLALTPITSLDAAIYYDDVSYDTAFTSNENYNTQGVGGSLKINQLIGDKMKLSAEASNRALYNTYGIELGYTPPFMSALNVKTALFLQRLVSSNETPSSNTVGLEVSMLGDDQTIAPVYQLNNDSTTPDIEQWVQDPAIYMQRVMIVAESQQRSLVGIVTSVTQTEILLAPHPHARGTAPDNTVTFHGSYLNWLGQDSSAYQAYVYVNEENHDAPSAGSSLNETNFHRAGANYSIASNGTTFAYTVITPPTSQKPYGPLGGPIDAEYLFICSSAATTFNSASCTNAVLGHPVVG